MTLQELWRGLWSEWLSAAFPLIRFIPLIVFIVGAYFLGDQLHQSFQESKQVVVEVVTETSHKIDDFINSDGDKIPSISEVTVHEVGQESTRVLRI